MKTTTAKTANEAIQKVNSRSWSIIKIKPNVALELLVNNIFDDDNDVAIMVKGYGDECDENECEYTGLYPEDVEDGELADWWYDYQIWVKKEGNRIYRTIKNSEVN